MCQLIYMHINYKLNWTVLVLLGTDYQELDLISYGTILNTKRWTFRLKDISADSFCHLNSCFLY